MLGLLVQGGPISDVQVSRPSLAECFVLKATKARRKYTSYYHSSARLVPWEELRRNPGTRV